MEYIDFYEKKHWSSLSFYFKFIVPAKYFIYIVGRGGSRLEEIKRGSGARVRYGPLQNDERLLVISGTHDQIDMAIYLIQNVIKRHLDWNEV